MKGRCFRCGDQELEKAFTKGYRIGVPWLKSFLQIEVGYSCPNCKRTVSSQLKLIDDSGQYRMHNLEGGQAPDDAFRGNHASFHCRGTSPKSRGVTLNYPSVPSISDNSLLPFFEGTVQDGTVIDQYGDPDLMADHSAEYLRQFWILCPKGQLPSSVTGILPALLLLNTAAELALKAYLIRSGNSPKPSHSLVDLYDELGMVYSVNSKEIEARFAKTDVCLQLSAQGSVIPKVIDILRFYCETYGGESSVHKDTRYYAEPTTSSFRKRSDAWSSLHGASLVKSNTPYPIFLPRVVQVLIDAYWFFSGSERLRRLGADLQENFRPPDNESHGKWGLIPSSLSLVAIVVSQKNGMGLEGGEVGAFTKFKELHRTNFILDWMYGGNTLLFYRADGKNFIDGKRTINGLECRIYSKERLNSHSRDLNLLADALEGIDQGGDKFGKLRDLEISR